MHRIQYRSLLAAVSLGAALLLPAGPALAQASPSTTDVATFDASRIGAMRYRMIGPARGGRVTAVAGVAQEPSTFYFGSTGGGVWKTTDAGVTWRSTGDQAFASASIGSINVAPSDPKVIYVGTGSAGIRSNVSIGRGIYKSTDAGKNWRFVGLRDAGQIGRIVVHPTNPDVAYAAVLGNPFASGSTRGIYRTRDGGATWQKVLFLSDSTGSSDVELQPGNPDVVYASMWHGVRKPWTIISGGAEDGIYRSKDGGEHWTKLGGGLPTGVFGKSDLSVSAQSPDRVYALIEAKPGSGLYRSDDAGESWSLVNSTPGLITRPFYYDHVHADPTNADVVYAGAEDFYKSTDGGRTFRVMRTPHGDNHDMWINPKNGQIFIQSNDGGANVSLNGGASWSSELNQPTAEIYQVIADEQYPYRVYGAQQDQGGTLIVTSLPVGSNPIADPLQSWQPGPGCETGPVMPHRTNPDTVYGSCKGQFSRMSLRTGQEKQYWVGAQSLYGNPNEDLRYRFQRVSPMEVSPHEPNTVYYGSQFVHRTRDDGVTWETISPDLTANDPRYRATISGEPITIDVTGEEMYATLYAIRESPVAPGVIWTGANDGPVYVTRDGGKSWANVTPKDLPPGGRVQNIEPSPRRPGAAYIAVFRYLLGDFQPYIYKTEDYGKTWKRLTDGRNGIPADAPTRVVREDPDRPGLLYAGTEFGMYVSFDDGAHWRPLQLNLPITPVTDIRVHRQDLVLSTQGRSFWILDDLTPLHQMSDAVAAKGAHLFAPRVAMRYRYRSGFGGEGVDRGASEDAPQYPPAGAMIDYWLAAAPSAPITLDILDASGKLVRSFSSDSVRDTTAARVGTPRLPTRAGLNRIIWDMTYPAPWSPSPSQRSRGPMAAPGNYTVRLTAGGATTQHPLVLRADPRVERDGVTQAHLEEQLAFNLRARDLVSEVNRVAEGLRSARLRLAPGATVPPAIAQLEQTVLTPPIRYSKPGLQAHIGYLYSMSLGADQQVGRDAIDRYAELRKQLDDVKARLAQVVSSAR
jgi:photosystem II stability/assembly factor-like uncharacterized protein